MLLAQVVYREGDRSSRLSLLRFLLGLLFRWRTFPSLFQLVVLLYASIFDEVACAKLRSKLFYDVSNSHTFPRVPRRQGRAFQSLSQDFVAGSDALGVEGCREDLTLGLQQIQQSGAWDGHFVIVVPNTVLMKSSLHSRREDGSTHHTH